MFVLKSSNKNKTSEKKRAKLNMQLCVKTAIQYKSNGHQKWLVEAYSEEVAVETKGKCNSSSLLIVHGSSN